MTIPREPAAQGVEGPMPRADYLRLVYADLREQVEKYTAMRSEWDELRGRVRASEIMVSSLREAILRTGGVVSASLDEELSRAACVQGSRRARPRTPR